MTQFGEGMVDVGSKDVTRRVARAQSTIRMNPETYAALMNGECPKGDVLQTARVAAIMAAKSTPAIIPLCHPLELSKIKIDFKSDESSASVTAMAEVAYQGRTGVEMEALTAVSAATLTIYDMMKWSDKGMKIVETKLLSKSGGKSGDYQRQE